MTKKKESKNVQIFLILLVVAIWGIIGWRIIQFRKAGVDNNLYAVTELKITQPSNPSISSNYQLSLDYPDPFLGEKAIEYSKRRKSKGRVNTKPSEPNSHEIEEASISLPDIQYQGYSVNDNRINRVWLVVEGKASSYQLNEAKNGIEVLEMYKDVVIVLAGNQQLRIPKN